jgi:DNA repair exonuclease SbcCD ATPase subunit
MSAEIAQQWTNLKKEKEAIEQQTKVLREKEEQLRIEQANLSKLRAGQKNSQPSQEEENDIIKNLEQVTDQNQELQEQLTAAEEKLAAKPMEIEEAIAAAAGKAAKEAEGKLETLQEKLTAKTMETEEAIAAAAAAEKAAKEAEGKLETLQEKLTAKPMEIEKPNMLEYFFKNSSESVTNEQTTDPVECSMTHFMGISSTKISIQQDTMFGESDSTMSLKMELNMAKVKKAPVMPISTAITKLPSIKTKLNENINKSIYFHIDTTKDIVLVCTLCKNEDVYELHFDRPIQGLGKKDHILNYGHLKNNKHTLVELCA